MVIEGVIRRRRLADAAIDMLAVAGLRGLTHRAVDGAAQLPEGSCSYYFRTRQALLQAAVDRLVEIEAAELDVRLRTVAPADFTDAAAALVRLIQHRIGSARGRTLARFELMLEATHNPELRHLDEVDVRLQAWLRVVLTGVGATDPPRQAMLLASCLDGLVLHLIARAGSGRIIRKELNATILGQMRTFAPG